MKVKIFTFALVFALFGTIGVAQEQDPSKYQPRTLSQIIKQHSQRVTDVQERRYDLLFDKFPSRVTVIYTGKSRKISSNRKEFISTWAELFDPNQEFTGLFEDDLLFVEDSVEYWLAVPKKLIPSFKGELKKGEKVVLLLNWIGARKKAGKVDWIFLVNGFEKQ